MPYKMSNGSKKRAFEADAYEQFDESDLPELHVST
jgi:hypothetical protein